MEKTYNFIAEQIYRCNVEIKIDLDEMRKEDKYKDWSDEDILLDYASQYRSGVFDGRNNWSLDESNVRSIYDENGEVYID